jgi:hypothetical protein
MNVTRNLVIDLLPSYYSGEASADTRALVEEYFREDPDFERIAWSVVAPLEALQQRNRGMDGNTEKQALQRTRDAIRRGNLWRSFAIAWMLAPFSFVFSHGHITWIMIRDSPLQAAMFLALSVACWLAYCIKRRMPHLQYL